MKKFFVWMSVLVLLFLSLPSAASWAAVPNYGMITSLPQTKDYGQLLQPVSLTFDSSGNYYVADQGLKAFVKFDAAGHYVTHWDEEMANPISITVDDADHVYVSDVSNRILIFDTDGQFIESFGERGNGEGQFHSPQKVVIDNLYIYVVDRSNNRIQVFNRSDYSFVHQFGTRGSGDGQFISLNDLAVDRNHHIYVADNFNHRIQLFHYDSGAKTWRYSSQFGALGNDIGTFNSPTGLYLDETAADTKLYVFNKNNHPIQVIPLASPDLSPVDVATITSLPIEGVETLRDSTLAKHPLTGELYLATGNVVANIHDPSNMLKWIGVSPDHFNQIEGIAVDLDNNIYVADEHQHRILKYDEQGNFLLSWGGFGTGDSEMKFPSKLAADADNNIYVVDRVNYRIQKFASDGTFLATWGSFGLGPGQFTSISSIAVDAAGDVYVTQRNHVDKFTSDGTFIDRWGNAAGGTGEGDFKQPQGLAMDSTDHVYVVDQGNQRIQKLKSDGTFVLQWGTAGFSIGSGDGEFNYPTDIVVDSHDHVFVSDSGNYRVQQFDSDGTYLNQWGDYMTFKSALGIAVNPLDQILVVDTNDFAIKIFQQIQAPEWPTTSELVLSDISQTSVKLIWPEAHDDVAVDGYRLYMNDLLKVDQAVSDFDYSVTDRVYSYTITELTPDTSYRFTVKAYDVDRNESDPGLSDTATTRSSSSSGDTDGGSPGGYIPGWGFGADRESLSDHTDLKLLEIHADGELLLLVPTFSAATEKYTVETEARKVMIVAEPQHEAAEVTWQNQALGDRLEVDLQKGENVFKLLVTAENGAKKTYELTIMRKDLESPDPQASLIILHDIEGHWAQNEIKRAVDQAIVNGYPDRSFKPNHSITRAEFTVMLRNALQLTGEADVTLFADQEQIGPWAIQAVGQAVGAGIISGYEDSTFRPNAHITRAEMAQMIAGALQLELSELEETNFTDDEVVPAWAKGAVEAIRQLGIVSGRGHNRFEPNETATRAESAVMLLRMLEHIHHDK